MLLNNTECVADGCKHLAHQQDLTTVLQTLPQLHYRLCTGTMKHMALIEADLQVVMGHTIECMLIT